DIDRTGGGTKAPQCRGSPGASTQFWLRRTNVWRRATSPRTGAKRLRSGQIDQVRSFERRFTRCSWMRSPRQSQGKDGRTLTVRQRDATNVELGQECISESTKPLCKSEQPVALARRSRGLRFCKSLFGLVG